MIIASQNHLRNIYGIRMSKQLMENFMHYREIFAASLPAVVRQCGIDYDFILSHRNRLRYHTHTISRFRPSPEISIITRSKTENGLVRRNELPIVWYSKAFLNHRIWI